MLGLVLISFRGRKEMNVPSFLPSGSSKSNSDGSEIHQTMTEPTIASTFD